MKAETAITANANLARAANRVPPFVMPLVKTAVLLADAVLTVVCFVLAFVWREGEPVLAVSGERFLSREFAPYSAVLLFAIPVRVALLAYYDVYKLKGAFSYAQEFARVCRAVAIGSLIIVAIAFMFRGGFAYREFSYSRGVFVLDFVLAIIAFTIFHLGLRRAQAFIRQRDINLIPTLIVGGGAEAEQTIRELQSRPDLGYRVVGTVENGDFPAKAQRRKEEHKDFVPVVGRVNDLPDLIKQLGVQEVIITDTQIPHERLFEAMMRVGRKQKVEFRFAPNLLEILPQKTEVEQIGVLPMVTLFREPLSDFARVVKRASDIAIAAFALTILAPLWIVLSVLIRLDSRGRILFRQERVGMDGRVFLCYKFRTMRENADETLHKEIYKQNIAGNNRAANAGNYAAPIFGKVKNDPRITRFGALLRRSSLDELPQLLNVLAGDMSIVGPRPPIPYEVEEYQIWHRRRLDMKPGITGLWQVSGRNRLTFDEMVKLDLFYIENWSLLLDLKIILLTLPAMLRGDSL